MKNTLKLLAITMVMIFVLVGCGKLPQEELNAAKASIDAAVAEGAQKYATEDGPRIMQRQKSLSPR